MKNLMYFVLLLVLLLTSGCVAEGSAPEGNKPLSAQAVEEKSSVYEVQSIDNLYGNWVKACNEKGCIKINLHKTDFRGRVRKGSLVEATETVVEKGKQSWSDWEYAMLER